MDITQPAQALLSWASERSTDPPPISRAERIFLPAALYAIELLDKDEYYLRATSIRQRVTQEQEVCRISEVLRKEAEVYLHTESEGLEELEHAGIGLDEDLMESGRVRNDVRGIEEELWGLWRAREVNVTGEFSSRLYLGTVKCLPSLLSSVIDLLLPPYACSGMPLLSTPVLVLALQDTWTHESSMFEGRSNGTSTDIPTHNAIRLFRSFITPR